VAREGELGEHKVDYPLGRFVALLRMRRSLDSMTNAIRALTTRPATQESA